MTADALAPLRGRRVFLTGHTGFKGAWAAIWLRALGAEVHGFALDPPTSPSLFHDAAVADLLATDTRADIRNRGALGAAMTDARPDVVLHMAAQSLVRESYRTPAATFEVNVQGTVNVLEHVRQSGRSCAVVVVTSDKCYENREHGEAYSEDDALGGHDPYSASKGAAEIVASAYRRSFFASAGSPVHVASARAGNVIGGGDWAADRLVPDLVRALASGCSPEIRNPAAVRPWQHVLEPLSGYFTLAARLLGSDPGRFASGWNFGPSDGHDGNVTVGEIAETVVAALGGPACTFPEQAGALHEARHLSLSIAKARAHLGWSPRWDLRTALRHTTAWYSAHHQGIRGAELRELCLADIADFAQADRPGGTT